MDVSVPELGPVGQRWADRFAHHAIDPESTLVIALQAAGRDAQLGYVDSIVSEASDGTPGWERVLHVADRELSIDQALDWVSAIAGVNPAGRTPAELRSMIPIGSTGRGSLPALREAVARTTLDGTLTIAERTSPFEAVGTDSPDDLLLFTHISVTPDVRATLTALREQNGGANRLHYRLLFGPTIDQVELQTIDAVEQQTIDQVEGTEPLREASIDQMELCSIDEIEATCTTDDQNYVVALADQLGA